MKVGNKNKTSDSALLEPRTTILEDAPKNSGHPISGFTLALIANLLWGTSFIASKYTLQAWGPFTASALRFALALAVMALLLPLAGFALKIPSPKVLLQVALVGLTGFGALYPLQLAGLNLISSGASAAIMLTSPLIVLGMTGLILREKISSRKFTALCLGIVGGCVLIFSSGTFSAPGNTNIWLGSILTLGASASLALSVIFTKKVSSEIDSANLTFWSMLIGLFILLPFSIHQTASNGFGLPGQRAVLALVYLAVVCSAVCFLIWNLAIVRSSPKELATTMHVKTPTAVILGIGVAGEMLSLPVIIGAGIVGVAVWLSQSEKSPGER